MQTGFIEKKNT